ncbi:succinylglutamate desuccinylase [Rubrivirga sp. SAORIC476]|uniref:succinylglutamate desuccinylase/aspartoacylase family protein n=1 Tax=Rubrivirga sp. SAORIC476 TaxID=1961794 RepID=UPI000BA906C9|nr:succinylglutamate desuccinylase/aspartoacylase family protein [Rubrivirga sp. SAORIC476]MAQ92805.1 succinylglutamate desuccinylase [Rhodothermaceae bacterium]MBC12822.1 succinylglutamate desuccinylase [Rhodothermaceae bacterium]PAP79519.1 succinylglutamate desuccinylase [Rubrivirga sp. SAORIC476]
MTPSPLPEPLVIGGAEIPRGTRRTIRLPIAPLYTLAAMAMPVHVVRGRRDGPRLFVSAAIHGDEILGVEIIRRLLGLRLLKHLRGTLIAVPVVNVYGYTARSRYLPDRRDLNRSFPGSPTGSMASRLAHTFMEEVVANATHGIDLHTGALNRTNLPQVRVSLDQEDAVAMAHGFRVPLILHANLRDGSMRQTVLEHGVPVLLYEAGEALRLDERSVRIGLRGVVSVMRGLGMLPKTAPTRVVPPLIARSSGWTRAEESGTLQMTRDIGDLVEEGEQVGTLTAPLGDHSRPVLSRDSGLIIGKTQLPLVYEGEALFHVARLDAPDTAEARLATYEDRLSGWREPVEADH